MVASRLLTSYRVLDLTNQNGYLCGKILADMGADVIKIERPGGDTDRSIGYFYQGTPDPKNNLSWLSYNLNKRGITLNIENDKGKQLFSRLVAKADFVIESFTTDFLDSLGLSYSYLSRINPRIVMTSITPFGQTGPYKNYKASDIEVMAMSGLMYITGNPNEAPLRISFPQAFLLASAHGAAATMVAHYYRESTGEGQHVDVSAQEVVLWEISNAIPLFELNHIILKRAGVLFVRTVDRYQTASALAVLGWLRNILHFGWPIGIKTNRAIVEWMEEKGDAPEFIRDFDWSVFDMATNTQEMQDRIEEPIADFFLKFNKAELYSEAQKRGIMLYPVSTSKDIVDSVQLKARDFWVNINHPELSKSLMYPGPFAKLSVTPLVIEKRAPLPGEHNEEIYQGELGLSTSDLTALKQTGVIGVSEPLLDIKGIH